jgi:hypothetical protein
MKWFLVERMHNSGRSACITLPVSFGYSLCCVNLLQGRGRACRRHSASADFGTTAPVRAVLVASPPPSLVSLVAA